MTCPTFFTDTSIRIVLAVSMFTFRQCHALWAIVTIPTTIATIHAGWKITQSGECCIYTMSKNYAYVYLQILTYVHLFGIAHKPFTQFSHLAKSEKLYSSNSRRALKFWSPPWVIELGKYKCTCTIYSEEFDLSIKST